MPNVSHENHLIFMQMTVQVTYIFIPIVSLKDSFCHTGKSKLGIGLFIHELLREPLILLDFTMHCLQCNIHYTYMYMYKQQQIAPDSLSDAHNKLL